AATPGPQATRARLARAAGPQLARRSRQQHRNLREQFLAASELGAPGVAARVPGAAATRFFDELHLAGKVAATGEKLIAAIAMRAPGCQSKGRLALPRACSGRVEMPLHGVPMVDAYLGPGEAHRLTKGQALPPEGEDAQREMDETVDIARPWLASFIARQSQGAPTDPLWTFTMAVAKRTFDRAAASLGLEGLQAALRMARRSGASIDRFTGRISLLEVQRRDGRRQPASARRCEKR
ncbi:unnamed protein product, partial [Prorocentrum cordatum]